MRLNEAMEAATPPPRKTKLDRYLDQMDPADRALVEEWLADEVGYSSGQIARALSLTGRPIGERTIREYRARSV